MHIGRGNFYRVAVYMPVLLKTDTSVQSKVIQDFNGEVGKALSAMLGAAISPIQNP